MRRFIFASHHNLATGLKNTVCFLTNNFHLATEIIDLSAYVQEDETDITERVNDIFSKFETNDEIIILTDMLGGSVNQKFIPYIHNRVHLITGMNLALAMSLILLPEDQPLSNEVISNIVEECKNQIIYVNQMDNLVDESDE